MIHYALKCDQEHRFESWFQSARAFDELKGRGLVACSVCGSTNVEKALMAPNVASSPRTEDQKPLTRPASPVEAFLKALRAHVEANADYVGDRFAHEARAIHLGEEPERPIYGEAKPDEVKSLLEEGVPVAPLPFGPKRKTN